MHTQRAYSHCAAGFSRRELLHMGLAAGLTVSVLPLSRPAPLWGAEVGPPRRGGILRVRGYDPVHFDHHLTSNVKTNTTLSFVHSTLLRYKVGPEITPGTFTVEPHLAERWEAPDDLTYVFHLRQGVTWHNRPPLNGRELVAEDVKFTFDRFLNEKANILRETLDPVERVEVVDRYTVQVHPERTFCVAAESLGKHEWHVDHRPRGGGEVWGSEEAGECHWYRPLLLERYEPNVKTVFKRNPAYFLKDQPYIDGVEWLVLDDDSTGLAMYRTGQIDCGPNPFWGVRQADLESLQKEPSAPDVSGLPVQCGEWHHHAQRSAAVQRRARAAGYLPRPRPAGPH